MLEIYNTPAATRDRRYRAWLTDLNYVSQRLAGCEVYARPERLRRMYRDGLDAQDALKRLHGVK